MLECIVVPVVLVDFCTYIVDVIIDVRLWYKQECFDTFCASAQTVQTFKKGLLMLSKD